MLTRRFPPPLAPAHRKSGPWPVTNVTLTPHGKHSLGRVLFFFRRRWRLGKFRVIHRNVLLDLAHLNCEPPSGTRQRPTERNLDPARFPIVSIIDLRRQPPQRRLSIANQPQQQP